MTDKPKILIVEDDTPVAMMMVHVLSRAGCDVLVANTGRKGMELAQENKFDLITLDVDLPDIGGFELCSELKQRHSSRHAPIFFISRRPDEKDRRHGLDLGAVDYIEKPFDALDFVSRVLFCIKPAPAQHKSRSLVSTLFKKVSQVNAKCPGNALDCVHRNVHASTLNIAEI